MWFVDAFDSFPNFTPASIMDISQRPENKLLLLPSFYEILTLEALKYFLRPDGNPALKELVVY